MYLHSLRGIGTLLLLTPTYACGQSLVERATVHIQMVGRIGQDLGESLGTARLATRELAQVFRPEQLSKNAFSLYGKFRPSIPEDAKGSMCVGLCDSLPQRETHQPQKPTAKQQQARRFRNGHRTTQRKGSIERALMGD